jgi:hypothetical protein
MCHRGYQHPRSLDLQPYNELVHVNELTIEDTQYCMYYALAPCLPVNRSVLNLLGLRSAPRGRLLYRGDVVFVKVGGPSANGGVRHFVKWEK